MRLINYKGVASGRQSGMTLVELLVASGIAAIILTVVLTLTVFATRSVLAMTNYTELDQASRNTLDLLTRDIRQASGLGFYSPSKIVLKFPGTNATCTYVYQHDGTNGTLVRMDSSGRKVLLEECDQLKFNIYTKAPSSGFVFNSANSNYTLAKLIDVSWKCSRQIKSQKVNTESIQTAKIVMRN